MQKKSAMGTLCIDKDFKLTWFNSLSIDTIINMTVNTRQNNKEGKSDGSAGEERKRDCGSINSGTVNADDDPILPSYINQTHH